MLVADASAVIASLTRDGQARATLAEPNVHAPHVIDCEVAHVLRGMVRKGELDSQTGWSMLHAFRWFHVIRHSTFSMFDRVWELRDNLTAYDAAYVALAEIIDCPLVTADGRISRAPGIRCVVTVVPD